MFETMCETRKHASLEKSGNRPLARTSGTSDWTLEEWQRPAGKSGGDFVVCRRDERSLKVFICDVSGHGDAVAAVADTARRMIEQDADQPMTEALLRKWNTSLEAALNGNFVCMTYMEIEFASRRMTVANAGNPALLIRRAANRQVEAYQSTGMPLGMVDAETWIAPVFEQVTLAQEDTIVCFTDGLPDHVGQRKQRFGMDRILSAITHATESSPLRVLGAWLSSFADQTAEQDDMTILSIGSNLRRAA